jgi:fructose-bisphosphate aldolase class II
MLVTAQELFKKAKKGGYAIGAFNTSNLEITKAIIAAAEKAKSPVIIETSEGEMGALTPEVAAAEIATLAKKAKVPIVLHLDHGKSLESVKTAVEAGYTSVHLDGSSLPYNENVKLTRVATKLAHSHGLTIEGEVGHIAGSSEAHAHKIEIEKENLTSPSEAAKFVKETGVDVLAVSIGNIHGVYSNPPQLDFERFAEIATKAKSYFSLHGGSGIPKNQIKKAIKLGISKVNVNTELRMAFHQGILHEFEVNPNEVVPYKYLPAGGEAVEKVVLEKIRLFGSAGKA